MLADPGAIDREAQPSTTLGEPPVEDELALGVAEARIKATQSRDQARRLAAKCARPDRR